MSEQNDWSNYMYSYIRGYSKVLSHLLYYWFKTVWSTVQIKFFIPLEALRCSSNIYQFHLTYMTMNMSYELKTVRNFVRNWKKIFWQGSLNRLWMETERTIGRNIITGIVLNIFLYNLYAKNNIQLLNPSHKSTQHNFLTLNKEVNSKWCHYDDYDLTRKISFEWECSLINVLTFFLLLFGANSHFSAQITSLLVQVWHDFWMTLYKSAQIPDEEKILHDPL